jgi:glycosyltransferase involved in cell wall biosynthesis
LTTPSNIKICHVTSAHQRTDDRIFLKECVSLAKAGFDVSLVVQSEVSEDDCGVHIVGIPERTSRLQRIFLGPISAFNASLKTGATIFHLHDPELLPLALLYRILGKKVIFDSHEDVPRQIYSKTWLGPKWMRKIISALYGALEWFFILFCSRVISVTPEITNRFPERKKVLIRNYPILKLVEAEKIPHPKLRAVYAGGLSEIRGICEVIRAIHGLDGKLELWLLGPWSGEEYRKKCMNEAGWKYTTYFGNVRPEEVYKYYAQCDIGIALLFPEENYLRSLPIKTFEYMAAGLPVMMSNFPYWLENFKDGAIFVDPGNVVQIEDALTKLTTDHAYRSELAEKGKENVMRNFSWENESKTLIQTYKELTGGR